MNKMVNRLEDFSFEKLEERKEFTFYYTCGEVKHDNGCDKHHNKYQDCKPKPPHCTPPSNGGGTPV